MSLMKLLEADGDIHEGILKQDRAEANYQLAKFARESADLRRARMHITKTLGDDPSHELARAMLAELG